MSCKNCGEKVSNRHFDNHISEQSAVIPNGYADLFKGVNELSFDTLVRMREDIRVKEEEKYKEMLKYMSDDLKALKILTFVKIFNGEEFSQEGHSPEYCLEMLYLLSKYEGTSYIFDKFSGLREEVENRHNDLVKKRLNLKIKSI